jgi:hypothetical protein
VLEAGPSIRPQVFSLLFYIHWVSYLLPPASNLLSAAVTFAEGQGKSAEIVCKLTRFNTSKERH